MSDYNIFDTGYANKAGTGTIEPVIVNSGNDVVLRAVTLSYDEGTGTDDAPNPSRYDDTEINYISRENAKITITGVIKASEHVAPNTYIKYLNDLKRTYGLKVLYYDGTDDFNDFNPVTAIGRTKADQGMTYLALGSSVKFLVVRVIKTSFKQDAKSGIMRFTMTCEVSNG